MSRYFRSEPVCCLWRVSLAALCLSFTLSLARGATLVQDFYLPMPEAQISQANNTIVSGSAGAVNSTFSILVTGDNTVIYYDQWEDGYETDLSNPTQSTTQIWGDGNDAHGIPPGFAHNPLGLPAGTVITLTNSVSLPRNPSQILWDARDHIAATKALVITRAAWPTSIGPVFAGAVGVLSTLDYGTNYISPVGQNMTNGLFKYVGLFVMAAQDNTSVLIDPNGNGVGTTNIVLNQGESYLVNGGIMTGGRVTATKPVQADLVIGDTKNDYASDWFTLYPVAEWSSGYYTPVSSAATQSQPAYVYLFNPNTNSIIINYSTLSGSGSFSVPPTNGVFQFQMPVASGASFSNSLGENFFAICTVAANPQNDTAYNWGFTLVPKAALTTQADVGWGPGSAQTNVDGSPVWVTVVAPTTVYVCYNGGTNGLLIDPNGNHYDTNFTLTALQSQKIYAPSKTQTGMKLYTVNGVLITAAWGEDADVASPANPYIDAGTTVIPFPVPTLIKTAVIVTDTPPAGLSLGDTIQYSVTINNSGLLPLGNTLVIDAPTTNLLYLTNSTTYDGTPIADSTGSQPFPLSSPGYTVPVILSQGTSTFTYLAKVVAPGAVSNSVNIGGTAIFSQAYLPPAITNGASIQINFTDTNRVPVGLYSAGAGIYVTVTNTANDATSTNITVSVQDTTHGDVENIVLTETSTNSGVFRNITGLPSSTTAGLQPQDGTLNVTPGDTLSVSYTDPIYGDSASNTAAIQIPALLKQLYLSFTNGPQNLDRIDPVAYLHGPTRTSIDIGTGSTITSVIGVAASNAVAATTGTTITVPINIGSGNNRLLLVGLSGRGMTNTAVTFNGVGLTQVGVASNNGVAPFPQIAIWSMVNPPAISNNVVATFTGSLAPGVVVGAVVFTNVNQTTPYGTYVASNNAATTAGPSITIASATNQVVFDTMEYDSGTLCTPGAGQTAVFNLNTGGANNVSGASICPSAASVTATWSNATTGRHWAIGAISLMPAAAIGGGGPSTNVTSFTQTPVFCSSFVMPSNNLVTITNYITVTNGIMPPNPAVTATLQYSGVNFLTLTNPTYSSTASNLIWSTLLSSNITVPGGQAITYVISNNQAGTAFHINYDSTNAQSKITLPTSTAIQIETFAVYDAPNPGGNLVITPTAGSTLYVRATVTDPFGTYDITGLGVAITAPVPSANLNTNLTAANIVADDGTNRTYEVAWTTGPTTGNFSIVATANEGTEGITATATASVSPITLDLGTPNTTEFTTSSGAPTNAYPGAASGFVYILVQDLGAITNPAVIQLVSATVVSSAGDSELLTLTETATNSGIFTNYLSTSTNGPDIPNDGLLYAPAGSLLTATYTNTTYPAENSSAIASILPPSGTPGVKIIKTIASPSGGDVGVGQPVVFNLKVINSGSTVLGSVVVTDNFPSSALSYSSASLTPSATTANSLTWTNLGGLIPGQSTNLTVTFTALVTGLATNFATANGGTATNTSSASILVTHTALNITKLVLSPTNSPVSVGSNIVFRLLIQNVGNTVIPTLPLEDNFSGAYFSFVTSTIPPNGSGYGSLIWTNLASPTALATNATITNDITMTVVGQGNPANNTAVADYAVDAFGNSVPTASGSTNVITAAATISGYVYNDKDQSGTLTAGDTPLSGVTIQIYTDPTGTGTPGTLVQETTTSSGGYYELDNLALGHYVVEETDLPGFANTVPSNGRLPFNLTTLTTSANNYFFQYQPNTSAYSTYSGRVINDLLGTGSNTNQAGLVNVTVNLVQDLNSNGIADPGEPVIYSDSTDTNGNYSFSGVVPGHYVIQEVDLYGYYSIGDSQPPNDNQISFITTTNGVTSTTNFFYERLSPVAVNDTNSGFYLVPVIISPLTNDLSPNGDPLTISNAFTTNGILVINPGSTNLTFTPTNFGVDTIIYTNADAHGGTSTAVITVNVTALADLSVAKSASAAVPATSNLTYAISVTNLGPSGAASVTVTDTVPVGTSFVSASGSGVNNAGVVTWNLGNLANGAASNVTLTVTSPANGTLTNVATVGSPIPDPVLTNNATPPVTTTVTPQADLQIGKSAAGSVLATSNLVYTISVTNFGPSVASSVTVTDSVPFGASFIGASTGSVNNSGVIIWTLGNLANGAISNVTLTVAAPTSGTLTNIATVGSPTGDPVLTNNTTPPVITTVTSQADLQIGKSASSSVLATSNLVYTISVTNFGPSTASSVTVTDSVPFGASFAGASTGSVNNSGVIVWSLGNLANGAVSNVTLTVAAPTSGTLTNVATVGSPTGDPVLTNNVTPPVTSTVTPQADLQIGKSAATSVLATSNLVYTISVTNFGPSTASSVTVTDAVPVGASFGSASPGSVNNSGVIVWSVGNLPSGAVSNMTLTVVASTTGTLTNVATVGSPTGDPVLTNNITPPVITTIMPQADLQIGKTAASSVLATSNLVYTISVTNFGPSVASGVTVTDTVPAGASFVGASTGSVNNSGVIVWSLGNLANGAVSNVTLTVAAPTSGTLTNVATVGSPTGDPVLTNNVTPPVTSTVTPQADLQIGKSAAASVLATSNLLYTISVTNFGPSAASSVTVTDSVPFSAGFVGASPGSVNNSGVIVWTLGNLANGAISNVTLTVVASTTGTLTNVATVGSPTGDPVLTNNITPPVISTITPQADLQIGKTAAGSVLATSNLVYTISVTNFGPSVASSVTVTDTVPFGASFAGASTGSVNNSGVIVWSLGNLASGAVSNVTLTVVAPTSGMLTNVATVGSPTSDPVLTNNVTPPVTSTVTPQADLQIGKTAAGSVLATSNLVYTISVTNFGPSTASSVTVTDSLPVGASFVSASPGSVNNGGIIVWNLGDLANGAVSNITLTVTASPSGTLTNVATVGSPTGDPVLTNNVTPPVTTTVVPLADLTITKLGPPSVNAASTFIYTIIVMNTGPSSASSVVVTDAVPAGLTVNNVTGDGVNNSGVLSWNLGTLASGQSSNVFITVTAPASGTLTNIASVASPTGDTNLANNISTPVITTVTPVADVSVVKSGPAGMVFNTDFNYTITASNAGPSTASSLTVTDSLPAGLMFVSSIPSTTTNASDQVIWNLGNFPANTGSNLTLTVISTQFGSLTNLASGGSPTLDPVPTNNTAPPVVTTVTNDPPIANPDSYAITENTTNIFSPLVNDVVQTPGGTLTIIAVSSTNGAVSILNNTNVVFTPATNFVGTTVIDYTITDNIGGTNSSTITVLVTNIPPIANPDTYSMAENGTNTLTPLVNDLVETPGGTLQIIGVSPTNGTASILDLTNVVFTPTHNFVGVATIGYTITDSIGGTNSSLITVNVTNIPPIAFAQSVSTTENTALPITLTGSDPAGQPLTFIIASGPSGGTITGFNTNTGALTYTPTNNFTGTDTFTFHVNNGYNNSPNVTVTIAVTPVADLLVAQSGPTSGVAGADLIFTVAVTNLGPASVTNIIVTNQLDAGYTFVSASAGGATNGSRQVIWTIPVLPANGSSNLTVTLTTIEGGIFTNVASGISITPDLNPANNNGSETNAQVVTTVSSLADVAVFKNGTTSVLAGGTVNYTITATNLGPSTASNVVVSDTLPPGVTAPVASGNYIISGNVITWAAALLPGGAATNFTVTVTAPFGGTLTNIASSTSDMADPNPGNNNGSSPSSVVITPVTPVADLAIGKSAAASVLATSNLVYTISVTNFGPSTASSVTVTDTVPFGTSFVGASAGSVNNGGVIVWNLGDLASGAISNVTLTVSAPTTGTLTNVAMVGSPTGDPVLTNNVTPPVVTTVIPQADLQIGKSATASVLATSNLVYTISVTNFGLSVASSVTVTDTVPAGASFVGASAGSVNNGGIIVWTLGNLASGAISNVTLTVSAPTTGTLTNVATVGSPTGDPVLTNNITPPVLTTVIPQADLQIGKTAAPFVLATSNLVYTISVTNFGPSVANSVTVTDTVPVGTSFVGASTGSVNNGGVIVWSLGNLASGAISNVTLTVAAPTTGTLTNVATVGSPTGDPVLTNNITPPVTTTVIPQADLQIGKSAATSVLATSNLVYTISVTNFGPSTASSVTVTDTVPFGGSFVSASVGSVNNGGVIVWSLGDLASGVISNVTLTVAAPTTGTLTNVATAGSPTGDPVLTNNISPPVITTVIPQADLQVGKSAAALVLATNNLVYMISVTNFGPSVANSVTVTDTVPVGASFVSASAGSVNNSGVIVWSLGDLASGVVSNVMLTVVAPTTGTLINVATVGSPTGDPVLTNNITPPVTTTVIPQADLQVGKTAAASVLATSNLVYTISVTNFGPSVASSVTVTDAVPVGASFVGASAGSMNNGGVIVWSLGDLASGAISNVTLTVAAPTTGTLTNVATAGSPTGDPVLTNNITPPVITTVIPQADLQIGKSATGAVLATSNLVYTISVTNFGPSTASGVTVTDTVPVGTSFVSASAGSLNSGGVIVWTLGNLASSAISNVTLTVAAPTSGTLTNVATVGSPTGDPVLTNNITPPVTTTVIPQADLQVGKSAAASVLATSNLVYTISVTNFGPSVASGVTVTDTVPVGASFAGASAGSVNNGGVIVWTLGNLASGAVSNVTLTVAAPTSGILINVATAGSPTGDPVLTNNVTPPVITTVIPQADIQIGKSAAGAVLATSNLVYTISVTNFGPSAAASVTVTDTVPVGASFVGASAGSVNNSGIIVWSLGNLASGAVSNVTLTVVTPTTGTLTNVATVGSPTGDPVLTNNITPPVTTTVIPQADLQIGKAAAASVLATSNLVYTISVTNFGPSTASSVTVTDTVPVGTSFIGASAGSVNNSGVIVWSLGDLASGAISNVTLTVAAPATGTLTNVATAGSPTGDPVLTNNITPPVITTVIPQADLQIGKTAAASVLATSNLLYTISVTNFGPSTASSVTVTDTVPVGASLVGASAGSVNSGGVIVWSLGDLASGAISNVTLTVAAPTSGILINVATAGSPTGDPVLTNNVTPPVLTVVIPQADLLVGKSAATSVLATSNLVYTISVTNFGPSVASGVTVTDTVPVGAGFVSASAGSVNNGGNIVWSLGNLASGAISNVTLTVAAPATGTLTNVATVGSPTGDPVLTNNVTPPVTTTVIPQADLQVGKTAAASILATSNLVYTISVTNFGPSTANSVTVTDSVPFGASFVSASAGSVNNGGVIVWSLGNLASGAASNVTLTVAAPTSGILINVASAGSPTGDPVLTNNITPPVLTVVIPQADLQIGKAAAASVLATSNLVYTISVTNFGPSVANSVTVTDTVPVGTSFVGASAGSVNNGGVIVWSLGNLASGAISNVTLTVAAPTSGTLTNVATVGSPTGDPVLTNNITPPVITTVIPQADLQIGKTAAASVLATSNLLYTISVTNFGPSMAASVTITDSVPFGTSFVGASAGSVNNAGVIVWSLGNLASGTISNVTLIVAAPTSGTLTNVATVGSPTGDPVLTNNITPPVLTTVIPQADVQIGKTAAASVLATSNLVYTISVTNFGPSTAASVTVTDTVPVGASFVGASTGSVNSGGVIVWSLGNLGSGAVSNVTLTVTAPTSGTLANVATAGSPTGDPVLTNNVTPPVLTMVIPQADLQIGKTAAASVLATSNFVYTISVTNVGPSAASSVTVTDTVPVGASFVSASSGSVNNSGVIVWSLGNLASGAVSNVTLTVAAPTSGTLTNVATVGSPTGDPVLTNNITPPVLTTIIPVADVGLGKSGPLGATFNTNFSYTITVTNFGPSTASGVLVTDTLPAGLVFVSAAPATGTNNIGQVIWSLGNFPAGTASNLTLTLLSTARGAVTNIASVGAPTLDPALVNNTSQPVISQLTNIPPIANPDSYSISENSGTNTFAPLVNDVVLNPGGTLQLISVNTTNGTAVINGTNVLFVPGTNYVGLLTINYTITDNVGGTNRSYITVLVTNIPPIANPDFYTVGENSGTATLNPLANDSVSTPGGILSLVRVSPTNGAANISGTNVLFTPALNFFGVATIGYTITDGIGGTNTSLITVIVTNVPPVANAQSVTMPENVPVQITLTGSDPNHLPLTYVIVGNPPNGTLSSLNPSTGTVTYTPGTNYAGSDSFTFRVNNGQTNSATATVSITITPVADLAVTQSGPATGFAGSNLVFTVTVTNLGPATATSLVISNALAAGYNFVSATGGGVDTGNLVIWDLATLPAHGVTNFTVTAFAAQGGAYTNIASGASAVLDLNPTNNNGSQISATAVTMITPVADLVVYKVGGTNVFAGATVSYTITASNAGPSTATSVVVQDTLPAGGTFQSATGTYSVSNGVVTWSGLTLTPGDVTTFNITLLASANVTSFINIASGTSPVFDPNPTNNNGSNILSRVTTKVTPSADVIAAIFGPATAFLGSNIVFTVALTNAGPSTASNVVVEDLLPPNLLFVSASNGGTNSNGTNASGTITWPPILALFAGETTNFTFTARSLLAGIYTNVVSSTSTTYDPNPTNNTGVLPSAQAETQVSQPQFTIAAGTPVFNPQDGLYEEQVTVTNTGSLTVPGFQLYVTGLRNGVSLYNAAGTNNGTPYVQYGYPLDPSNSVHFVLEFHDPSRQAFTNGLYVVAYMPTNGTISGVSNGVPVTIFEDDRSTPPRMVLEWPSVIGTTYLVIYATTPNATSWNIATPSITATANITQWYDDGPPKTQSAPLNTSARFYRVIKY